MNNLSNLSIGVLLCFLSLIFYSCENQDPVLPENDVPVVESARNIPKFNLFHPTRGVNASVKNDKFFSQSGSTHKFFLPKGTVNKKVSRRHARIEVNTTSGRFKPGATRSFSAKYNVSTTVPGQVTVTQLFATAGKKGPQIRIEVRSDGSLRAGWGYGSQSILARKGQWNRRNFTLKITSDGRTASIYLNGKRKVNKRRLKHQNATNQFRWGLYYNNKMPKDVRSTMSNIRLN